MTIDLLEERGAPLDRQELEVRRWTAPAQGR